MVVAVIVRYRESVLRHGKILQQQPRKYFKSNVRVAKRTTTRKKRFFHSSTNWSISILFELGRVDLQNAKYIYIIYNQNLLLDKRLDLEPSSMNWF